MAIPLSKLRCVLFGSGSDGLAVPEVAETIISLTCPPTGIATVAYLGTATYDKEKYLHLQTGLLSSKGCKVVNVNVADPAFPANDADRETLAHYASLIENECDVIVVSGGNTLYAVERWFRLGIVDSIKRAVLNRNKNHPCVLAGGSAGAICWFDAGHSDSMDPASFREAMTASASLAHAPNEVSTAWEYIRVGGLGFIPGLLAPHYDVTQSNGRLRSVDLQDMMRAEYKSARAAIEVCAGPEVLSRVESLCEEATCLDHWAGLVMNDGNFTVLSLKDKANRADSSKKPWVYRVCAEVSGADVTLHETPFPEHGRVEEWFKGHFGPADDDLSRCRREQSQEGAKRLAALADKTQGILKAPISVVRDSLEEKCSAMNASKI